MTPPPKRILIIRLSAIGDVLRVLPAFQVLKKNYPGCHIGWVVEQAARDILQAQPGIDEVFVFPKESIRRKLKSITGIPSAIAEFFSFMGKIRRERFDLAIDFHGLFKSGVISFFSGAPERAGFAAGSCKELNFLFNNRRFALEYQHISRVERNLWLLRSLGLDTAHEPPFIHVPEEDQEAVQRFFRQQHIDRRRPIVAIHPGTSPTTPYKRWEPHRYAVVADKAIEESAAQVIFTWAGREIEMVNQITSLMKYKAIIAPQLENLCQLAEVFRSSDVYLGGDTGPMHLAAFVGIPVVAIFGPTDHVVNEPYAVTPHIIIRDEIKCSPCRRYTCSRRDCMRDISEENVIRAVRIMLETARNRKLQAGILQ
jgi:lipopolysaccharide heptosyltransferase I